MTVIKVLAFMLFAAMWAVVVIIVGPFLALWEGWNLARKYLRG